MGSENARILTMLQDDLLNNATGTVAVQACIGLHTGQIDETSELELAAETHQLAARCCRASPVNRPGHAHLGHSHAPGVDVDHAMSN